MNNLKKYSQWILWRADPRPEGGTRKTPCAPDGSAWDAHDTRIHMPYEIAEQAAAAIGAPYRVGFVVTALDPFFFVDIDNCRDATGQWTPNAVDIMQRLAGSAVMLSQSGQGLHIVGSMHPYPGDRVVKPHDKTFDGLFTEKRFIATTGQLLAGSSAADLTVPIHTLIAERLPPKAHGDAPAWNDGPREGYTCTLSDEELLKKALASRSIGGAFGDGVSFVDLWTANEGPLGAKWPDDGGQGRAFDRNPVDAALAAHLAWWTGHDPERIDRLMRQSALMRDKWDARPDYMQETILGACANVTGFYDPEKAKEKKQEQITETLGPRVDPYCDVLAQRVLFKGHVYVHDKHNIFTPDGLLHTPIQYRAMYGGRIYALDRDGVKNTRNAWEALTESVDLRCPRVVKMVFRPKAEPAAVLVENGKKVVNRYIPAVVNSEPGDLTPFLRHVESLLPNEGDRNILLDYMAAIVQRPGDKFQWCPVIQGIAGNGKTLLYDVLEYAVSPEYSHKISANDIGNVFNAWLENKILGCVEEIRVGGDREKAEVIKEMITNRRMPMQGKGANQTTGDSCMNFILFSNHKDAVLKTVSDRRYCVFYTAQQDISQIQPDAYYNGLYEWLAAGGFAYVAHYLKTRIVQTNMMGRAPRTTSTPEALKASLGIAEQIIIDNIELKTLGFRADIISSSAINFVLSNAGKKLGPKNINILMRDLGYVRHDGAFCINGERFRAYVPTHSLLPQTGEAALRERYVAANTNTID